MTVKPTLVPHLLRGKFGNKNLKVIEGAVGLPPSPSPSVPAKYAPHLTSVTMEYHTGYSYRNRETSLKTDNLAKMSDNF